MRIIGKIGALWMAMLCWNGLFAQVMEEGVRTANFGIMVQPKTFGADFKLATSKANRWATVMDFDLIALKHPKEQKVTNNRFQNSAPFVYGKLNDFYTIRAGYGLKKIIGERVSRNTVNVALVGTAGLSLGITKAVHLEVYRVDSTGFEQFQIEKYDPAIHNPGNIVGGAGFNYGFGDMGFVPGFYGKAGIEFGWGNYKTSYMALEIGATTDVFFKDVPIMHFTKNRSVFPGFYASFALVRIY